MTSKVRNTGAAAVVLVAVAWVLFAWNAYFSYSAVRFINLFNSLNDGVLAVSLLGTVVVFEFALVVLASLKTAAGTYSRSTRLSSASVLVGLFFNLIFVRPTL